MIISHCLLTTIKFVLFIYLTFICPLSLSTWLRNQHLIHECYFVGTTFLFYHFYLRFENKTLRLSLFFSLYTYYQLCFLKDYLPFFVGVCTVVIDFTPDTSYFILSTFYYAKYYIMYVVVFSQNVLYKI